RTSPTSWRSSPGTTRGGSPGSGSGSPEGWPDVPGPRQGRFRDAPGCFPMGKPACSGHARSMNENLSKKKTLRRSNSNRILTGVCGGIGEFLGVDANLVRLAFAVFTLLGGSGVLLYLIAWLVIPEEGTGSSVLEHIIRTFQGKESKL